MLNTDFFGDGKPGKERVYLFMLDFLDCIVDTNLIQYGLVLKRK